MLITAVNAKLGYSREEEAPSTEIEVVLSLDEFLVWSGPELDVRAGTLEVMDATLDSSLSVRLFVVAVLVGTEAVMDVGVTTPDNVGSGPKKRLPFCPSART